MFFISIYTDTCGSNTLENVIEIFNITKFIKIKVRFTRLLKYQMLFKTFVGNLGMLVHSIFVLRIFECIYMPRFPTTTCASHIVFDNIDCIYYV